MSQMYTCGPVTTPGTPQKMFAACTPALATIGGVLSGTIPPRGSCVVFQAHPGNTASKSIFIGTNASMSVSGKTGLGMAVTTGGPPLKLDANSDGGDIDLGEFWIDTDGTTEKLLVTVGP